MDIINETSLNSTEDVGECEDWSLLDQPRIRYTIIVLYVFVLFVCLLGRFIFRQDGEKKVFGIKLHDCFAKRKMIEI